MKTPKLTAERLRDALSYDPDTGLFTWKVRPSKRSRRRIGDRAGTVKAIGGNLYCYIGIDGEDFIAAQLAWLYVHGEWPKARLAPQNGDPADTRIANLVEMPSAPGDYDFSSRADRLAHLRAHRKANRDHYRNKDLLKSFGISLADYNRMLAEQGGVCTICSQPETTLLRGKIKNLAVDHDHATGAIRGLLCSNCNPMIGYAQDDPVRLFKAIEYLRRHKPPLAKIA